MDIDLLQGLGEIAEDAPVAHLSADSLWRQGRRRLRRRRAAALAASVAAVALVAGAVGYAVTPGRLQDSPPPPAAAVRDAHLPARVWMPSPWTPGTDEAGAPGRIAVLFWDNGQRRTFPVTGRDAGQGFVAVSAVDGKYRYLDLPGLVFDGDPPVLSPDGRYVAYALRTGGGDDTAAVTTGWAVYDAQTGRTVEHRPRDVPKGLGQGELVWSPDSRTLLADVCRITAVDAGSQSCTTRRADAWDVATGEVREIDAPVAGSVLGHLGDDLLQLDGRRLQRLDPRTGRLTPLGRVGAGTASSENGEAAASLSGRVLTVATQRYAGVDRSGGGLAIDNGSTLSLRVSRQRLDSSAPGATWVPVRGAGEIDPVRVDPDGSVTALVVRAKQQPVVSRLTRAGSTDVVRFQPGWGGALPQVAADLLSEPTVPGTRPPDLRDPRAVGGWVALGVGLAGLGLVWVRRRRGVRA